VALLLPPANVVRLCPPETASTSALPVVMSPATCTVPPSRVLPAYSTRCSLSLYPRWCVECMCELFRRRHARFCDLHTIVFHLAASPTGSDAPRLISRLPLSSELFQEGNVLIRRDAPPALHNSAVNEEDGSLGRQFRGFPDFPDVLDLVPEFSVLLREGRADEGHVAHSLRFPPIATVAEGGVYEPPRVSVVSKANLTCAHLAYGRAKHPCGCVAVFLQGPCVRPAWAAAI
jgi:hypothetical protein